MEIPQVQKPMVRTWKPTVAGILDIVDAAGTFIFSFFLFMGSIVLSSGSIWLGMNDADFYPLTVSTVGAIVAGLGVLVLACAIVELIGGIAALQRKKWGLALAGSIVAAIPGNVLGILAIIFLAMSKDEFV